MTGIQRLRLLIPAFIISAFLILSGCVASNAAAPWQEPSIQANASQAPDPLPAPAVGSSETQSPPIQAQQASISTKTSYAALPAVKVAILLPLSGKNAAIGRAMLQAAQLAVFDIGYESFELMPRDTKGTPQGALQAATSALNDGAQLILGPLFGPAVSTVKNVASARRVNVIAFSTDWTLAGGNTYLMGFMPFSQVARVTAYAASKGIRTAGMIAPRDKYGDTVTRSFETEAQRNGIHITERFRFAAGNNNVTAQLKPFTRYNPEALKENPDLPPPYQAVFMPVGGQQADMLGGALGYYGITPDKVRKLGTGLWDDPRVANLPHMQGAWFAAPSPRLRKTFEDKYRSTYGQKPPRLSSMAYDATALAAVLARTGFQRTGRPAFDRASLTNPNGFAGMDGIFRFGQKNLVERGLAILEIRHRRVVEIAPAPKTFQR